MKDARTRRLSDASWAFSESEHHRQSEIKDWTRDTTIRSVRRMQCDGSKVSRLIIRNRIPSADSTLPFGSGVAHRSDKKNLERSILKYSRYRLLSMHRRMHLLNRLARKRNRWKMAGGALADGGQTRQLLLCCCSCVVWLRQLGKFVKPKACLSWNSTIATQASKASCFSKDRCLCQRTQFLRGLEV